MGAGELDGWQWRLLLYRTQPVTFPDRWPEGHPIAYSVRTPFELGNPRVIVKLSFPEKNSNGGKLLWNDRFVTDWAIGSREDHIDAKLTVRCIGSIGTEHTYSQTLRIPITPLATPEKAREAYEGPEADELARALFSLVVEGSNKSGCSEFIIGLTDMTRSNMPEDVGLGVVIELRRDGEVHGTWNWCLNRARPGTNACQWGARLCDAIRCDFDNASDVARWSIRVRGSAGVAVVDISKKRYWRGEFEVPLAEVLKAGQ